MSDTISTSEARGAVEKWLLQVQDVMLVSIRDIIERAIQVCGLLLSDFGTRGLYTVHYAHCSGILFNLSRLTLLMKEKSG